MARVPLDVTTIDSRGNVLAGVTVSVHPWQAGDGWYSKVGDEYQLNAGVPAALPIYDTPDESVTTSVTSVLTEINGRPLEHWVDEGSVVVVGRIARPDTTERISIKHEQFNADIELSRSSDYIDIRDFMGPVVRITDGMDITTPLTDAVAAANGERRVIYVPPVYGQALCTTDLDLERCTLRGAGDSHSGAFGGSKIRFTDDHGIFSSTPNNFGFALEDIGIYGSIEEPAESSAGQILVNFNGQNRTRLTRVTLSSAETGLFIGEPVGTTVETHYGRYEHCYITNCFRLVHFPDSGKTGVHTFNGGRLWGTRENGIGVDIGDGVFSINFFGTSLELGGVSEDPANPGTYIRHSIDDGIRSKGRYVNLNSIHTELVTTATSTAATLHVLAGAGEHYVSGGAWSSGLHVRDDNIPVNNGQSVVYSTVPIKWIYDDFPNRRFARPAPIKTQPYVLGATFEYETTVSPEGHFLFTYRHPTLGPQEEVISNLIPKAVRTSNSTVFSSSSWPFDSAAMPANSELTVTLNDATRANDRIAIYDQTGSLVDGKTLLLQGRINGHTNGSFTLRQPHEIALGRWVSDDYGWYFPFRDNSAGDWVAGAPYGPGALVKDLGDHYTGSTVVSTAASQVLRTGDRTGVVTVDIVTLGSFAGTSPQNIVNGSKTENAANAWSPAQNNNTTPGSGIRLTFLNPEVIKEIQTYTGGAFGGQWQVSGKMTADAGYTLLLAASEFTDEKIFDLSANTVAWDEIFIELVSGTAGWPYLAEVEYTVELPAGDGADLSVRPSSEDGSTNSNWWLTDRTPVIDGQGVASTKIAVDALLPPLIGPASKPDAQLMIRNISAANGELSYMKFITGYVQRGAVEELEWVWTGGRIAT